jgi:hypothetical protein
MGRLMQSALLRDLAYGLPIDREALASEIPGSAPADVDVALDVLVRGLLVRIVSTSGVDDAPTFEVTNAGRRHVRDS